VLDNAQIHHNDKTLELVDHASVHLKYLPPYSPDLNPIEEAFSKIKHFLHRHTNYYAATTGDGILYDILEVLDVITASDAEGYFAHAGYF
jgi:transposase